MKSSSLPILVASSIIFLITRRAVSSSAVTGISGKSTVTYDIPVTFSPGDNLITQFKAVSSHGRASDTDALPTVTYTSYQVVSRALYLFLVFAPMIATSGLACISSSYRNGIWYRLLKYGISQGGAVCSRSILRNLSNFYFIHDIDLRNINPDTA